MAPPLSAGQLVIMAPAPLLPSHLAPRHLSSHISMYPSMRLTGAPCPAVWMGGAALEVDGVAGGGYKRALAATCSSATRLTTRGELDDGRAQPFGVSSMRVGHRELPRGGPSLPPASSMWMHL